jgi:hypothetical protein
VSQFSQWEAARVHDRLRTFMTEECEVGHLALEVPFPA